jgi:hypothetical protein
MHYYAKLMFPRLDIEKKFPKKKLIKRDFKDLNKILPLVVRRYSIQDFMTVFGTNFLINN